MKCSDCKFWKPTYRGVGECMRAGGNNTMLWIEGQDQPRLMTIAQFSCAEYSKRAEDLSAEVL